MTSLNTENGHTNLDQQLERNLLPRVVLLNRVPKVELEFPPEDFCLDGRNVPRRLEAALLRVLVAAPLALVSPGGRYGGDVRPLSQTTPTGGRRGDAEVVGRLATHGGDESVVDASSVPQRPGEVGVVKIGGCLHGRLEVLRGHGMEVHRGRATEIGPGKLADSFKKMSRIC